MNPEQWRNIKRPYVPKPFADKFKIDVEQLLLDTRRTQLQVDLVEANGKPNLVSGRILDKTFFADVVPWIALTLIEL
jgi:hypothetical protein